ncbi:MAG: nitronate monooxygenase [Candidatus Methylacidiphilales bacterium]
MFPSFQIIQGGMGAGVSGWRLARAVSQAGQLGVVSGTAVDVILARQLQMGDTTGDLRRALDALPMPGVAGRVLQRYFIAGGKKDTSSFRPVPMMSHEPSLFSKELAIAAAFVFIFLAKENHSHPVGLNLLEKIQLPTLLLLFGAMLAGVDVVLMGAGIPRQIPALLDRLAAGEEGQLKLDVTGGDVRVSLNPLDFVSPDVLAGLKRPRFLAIVSSPVLAKHLAQKCGDGIDGWVVEHHTAGGHNAPPRGRQPLSSSGEPVYSERDEINAADFTALGKPFWLAGGCGRPGALMKAREAGAAGIQVGTLFAFCEESGLDPAIKEQVLEAAQKGTLTVFTDPKASPTRFPFKVVGLPGTLSESDVYDRRERICDIGLLRECTQKLDGSVVWRCPSEPEEVYAKKGGCMEDTPGRMCLCNALMAGIGLGQRRDDYLEPALLTAGDDLVRLGTLMPGRDRISATDVLDVLLTEPSIPG